MRSLREVTISDQSASIGYRSICKARITPESGIQDEKEPIHFLEILKLALFGIASALYDGHSEAGASERNQTNNREQKVSNVEQT